MTREQIDALYRHESGRHPGHPDPPARRLRPRRGGAAGGVRRGDRPVAARGRARRADRVDRPDRQAQGDRSAAPRQPLHREARHARRDRRDRARDARRRATIAPDPGRPPPPALHLLPSGARRSTPRSRSRCARSAASPPRRSRAPSWCRSRRSRSASCARRRRSATPASPTGSRRPHDLPERLEAVMAVVYLIFTEGHAATQGDAPIRADLCAEAIRLARLLVRLFPDVERGPRPARAPAADRRPPPRPARRRRRRRPARGAGPVALGPGRRSPRASALLDDVVRGGTLGPYALQAAIAAVHARAARARGHRVERDRDALRPSRARSRRRRSSS